MSTVKRIAPVAAVCLVLGLGAHAQGPFKLPKIQGQEALASVNGEPVTLEEYMAEFASMHADAKERGQVVPKRDPADLLDRLVSAKLILQEAVSVGLDELPQFEATMRAASKDALRAAVLSRAVQDVPEPTAARVDALYQEKEIELQVASAVFKTKEDAERYVEELTQAPDFVQAARWLVAEGSAVTLEDAQFLKRRSMLPEAIEALEGLEDGKVTPPVAAGGKVFVIKVLGRRVPQDAAAREAVRQDAWNNDRGAALGAYVEKLRQRRVKIDEALVKSLDFDADPKGFSKFLEDERVVATVKGTDPIRVKDVAAALKKRFFHGIEQAAEKKRLGKAKMSTLEELTTEAAIAQEGRDLKLDQTPEYKAEVRAVREQALFGLFVQKVVEPSIRIDDAEVRKAYEAGKQEFTSPEMLRVESLAFADAKSGQRAVERLRAGANLGWMRSNAEGRVDAKSVPEGLRFDGRLVMLTSLAPDVQKVLEGAVPGDYRLYTESGGRSHVLALRERVPPKPTPFEEVRMEVARRVFNKKRDEAMDDWAAKLRKASDIQVFATSDQLRELTMRRVSG